VLLEGLGRSGGITPLSLVAVALSGVAFFLQLGRDRRPFNRSLALASTVLGIAPALVDGAHHATDAGAVLLLTTGSHLGWSWRISTDAPSRRPGIAMQHAEDAMSLFDEQPLIIEANHRAVTRYGYPRTEFLSLHASDSHISEKRSAPPADFASTHTTVGLLFETIHRGSRFTVDLSRLAAPAP
jgi:PAS domain-containing protein